MRAAAEACGERADWIACDVTDPEADAEIVAEAIEQMGGIDVLVNNAGTSFARDLDELTDEDWLGQYALHVLAPMRLMRAAAPHMAARGGGRIVNVASSAGKRPSLMNVAYSVTKAAQLSLSRAFADAYAAQGVLVNAVTPGGTASELWMDAGGMADQIAASGGISREDALAGAAREDPARAPRRARRDRRRDRVPLLGALRRGDRRGVVRRRRLRAGHHLIPCCSLRANS